MLKILIAEDEEPIANLIKMNLRRAGYSCVWAPDGEKAADLMDTEKFDLVLLDVMLPGINGFEVKGLKMGADDYLTKPFEIVELLARVEAVLRRYHKTETLLTVFDVVIDTASRSVTQNGEPVPLTMKEFELLLLLARNRNIALYRETIYENIWGGEYMGQSRTVDLHIQRLKKKLNWDNEITAVYKVGYRLEGEEKITKS